MNYNGCDYKELIEAFCEEKNYTDKQKDYLLKPYIYEKDLFNLMPFQLGNLVIEDMCGMGREGKKVKGKSADYLKTNYSYINQFFNWCVSKEYIPLNPFQEIDSLSCNNLLYQMAEQTKVKIIYEEDLTHIIEGIEYNKEFYSVVLGLLFEGVANNSELAMIKHQDVSGNILKINQRNIKLSESTANVIDKYKHMDMFYIERNNTVQIQNYIQHKDFLFKKIEKYYNPEVDDLKYIKSIANTIGSYLNKLDLNYIDIIRSGFINALRKEFDKFSDEDFCEIFMTNKKLNTGITGKINKVMDTYGGSSVSAAIDNCFPYIINSKYYK